MWGNGSCMQGDIIVNMFYLLVNWPPCRILEQQGISLRVVARRASRTCICFGAQYPGLNNGEVAKQGTLCKISNSMGQIVWSIKGRSRYTVMRVNPGIIPKVIVFGRGAQIFGGSTVFISEITDLFGLGDDCESNALGTGQQNCK